MIPGIDTKARPTVESLAAQGYWTAQAAVSLAEGKCSDTIRICREHLESGPHLTSGRAIYASALLASGQSELAAEEYRKVLALDPDHQVALKGLGDIAYAAGDSAAAMSYYQRILEIDPDCRGLKSRLAVPEKKITRTVTLTRPAETTAGSELERKIPFFTETIGDLYLAQGHSRLAVEVFRRLSLGDRSSRIAEKLALAESRIREKEL